MTERPPDTRQKRSGKEPLETAILESISDAVAVYDREWRLVYVNRRSLELGGRSLDELLGRVVWDLYPHLVGSPAEAEMRRAMEARTAVDVELYDERLGRWFETHAYPFEDGLIATTRDVTERKRAEQELLDSRQMLSDFVENATIGLHWVGPDGTIEWANQAELDLLGYTRDEYVGHNIAEFHADPDVIADILRRLTDDEALHGYEARLRAKDGSIRCVLISSNVYRENGRFVHTRCFTRDITDRRRAEQAVLESQKQLRLVTDTAPANIAYCDPDRRLRFVNRPFAARFGLEPGDFVGRTIAEGIGDQAYETIRAYVDEALSGRAAEFEAEMPYRDYGTRYMRCALAPDLDEEGLVRGFVVVSADLTERRRGELERERLLEELETEQARLADETRSLETIIRLSAAISSELNLERLVQEVTDEATALTGAAFGSFFYNVLSDAGESYMLYTISGVPKEAFAKFPMPRNTAIFDPTFRGEGVVRLDDVTRDPRFGKSAPYHGMPKGHLPVRSYLAVPVVSRSGEVLGGLFFGHPETGVFTESDERILEGIAAQTAIAMDNARLFEVTRREREEAERSRRQAEEANRAKDEFLAVVSHELRTPLNSILGWTRMLRAGGLDAELVARALETIERNVKSQAQLIEDILDVSRIVTGKLRLNVQPIEVAASVEAALDSVRLAAEAKRIRLESILDPSAGPVSGDPERLQQIVWNLLSNAIKFTPKEGKVQVRLARVNSHVELVVADSGQGINPEFLPYVFERFRQADASITRASGGLGLGLAIVRHLVELHGGTVRAESEGDGRGSTFTVCLPLMPLQRTPEAGAGWTADAHAPVPEGILCPPALAGVKVLVVDDEADTREMLTVMLERCDTEVRTAGSAAEALEILDHWQPDLLVSDIGMPHEDGYDLIKRIRERAPDRGGNLPAVALTAYARFEDRMRALGAGFQMHVAKPVEPAELLMVVYSLLEFRSRT